MDKWEPEQFEEDPVANAIMNVASELNFLANATQSLLYGLKYGKETGMSIAEAIEVGLKAIADRPVRDDD